MKGKFKFGGRTHYRHDGVKANSVMVGLMVLVILVILIVGTSFAKHALGPGIDTSRGPGSNSTNAPAVSQLDQSSTVGTNAKLFTDDTKQALMAVGIGKFVYDHGSYIVNDGSSGLSITQPNAKPSVVSATRNSYGQLSSATAFLDKSSRQYRSRKDTGNDELTYKPAGYHQMPTHDEYKFLYNRGHLLGYAIVGNVKGFDASETNRDNIVTQTAWSNQAYQSNDRGQNYYEGIVRNALDANKRVFYIVQPIYVEREFVPRFMWLRALSTDNSVNFSVLVPNVQPGYDIDYQTGYAKQVSGYRSY